MATVELGGNADAVEFCPNEPYLHILAAASYTLQEDHDQQGSAARLGGLYLFSADHKEETPGLTKFYHREAPGVFDIKWRPYEDGPPSLAQASADGSLCLHTLTEGSDSATLELQEKANVDVSTSMCLYVDWNPVLSSPEVVLSHSDGCISLVGLGQSEPEISASWQAHNFEAWVAVYASCQTHVLYSGGDDCQFCCWDLRENPSSPVFRDRKTHSMGVTSIQSNVLWENMLVTGSYDESLRLFDMRMAQKPLMRTELGLGGGVWRVKWHHTRRDVLLAACMHNGAAIAQVGDGGFHILEQYEEHTSLTYGASWCRGDLGNTLDVLEGDTGLDAKGHGRLHSSDVTNSDAEESKQVRPHLGEIDETARAQQKVTGEGMSKGDNGHEGSLSVDFRQLGLENSMGMRPLVATCSFYDRAVHLWRPRTFSLGQR
ncbi:unnamed protein product [Calypogeia fissa]